MMSKSMIDMCSEWLNIDSDLVDTLTVRPEVLLAPGYESLASVLKRAFEQASKGKGKERHANDLPFDEQPMQTISELLDSTAGMEFQAIKKIREAKSLPTFEQQERELLGAINYIAGILIFLENRRG